MADYVVAFTGASGIIYGIRLVEELLLLDNSVHLIVSEPAKIVIFDEMNLEIEKKIMEWKLNCPGRIIVYDNDNIAASLASGSFISQAMVVIPCSMASLSAIAVGSSRSLIERAADVMLKERRKLILVPRETPLSSIHLRNMLNLSEMGAQIIPAMPAFYHKPESIDDLVSFLVGKVLDSLGLNNQLFKRYEGKKCL